MLGFKTFCLFYVRFLFDSKLQKNLMFRKSPVAVLLPRLILQLVIIPVDELFLWVDLFEFSTVFSASDEKYIVLGNLLMREMAEFTAFVAGFWESKVEMKSGVNSNAVVVVITRFKIRVSGGFRPADLFLELIYWVRFEILVEVWSWKSIGMVSSNPYCGTMESGE